MNDNDINQFSKEKQESIIKANANNPYTDILPFELNISWPVVNYKGFFLGELESYIYAVPARLFTDKEKTVGYTGKSVGTSFRLTKNLRVHSGGRESKPIRQNVRDFIDGDLIITNKRLVFISNTKSFDYKLDKITALKMMSQDTFFIQIGNRNLNINVNESNIAYSYAFLTTAINLNRENKDIYGELTRKLTDKEENLLALNRKKLQENYYLYAKNQNRTNRKSGCFKILSGLIVIVVIFSLIISFFGNNTVENGTTEEANIEPIMNYTVRELFNLEGHPKIYDSIESTKSFYNSNLDSRIEVVTDVKELSIEKSNWKDPFGDKKTKLYFIEDSSGYGSLGYVEFYINNSEEGVRFTIDEVLEIIVDYLPDNFFEYYNKDVSFKYEQNGVEHYGYGTRLNDSGVEYHNSGEGQQYSYYYGIRIAKKTDDNSTKEYYIVRTTYAAYADESLGWLQNYAQPWEINLESYRK